MEDAVDGGGGGSPLPAESGERTGTKRVALLAAGRIRIKPQFDIEALDISQLLLHKSVHGAKRVSMCVFC